jgi:hypothetical protein
MQRTKKEVTIGREVAAAVTEIHLQSKEEAQSGVHNLRRLVQIPDKHTLQMRGRAVYNHALQ